MINLFIIIAVFFSLALFAGYKIFLYLSGQNINDKSSALKKVNSYIKEYGITKEDIETLFNQPPVDIKKVIIDKENKVKKFKKLLVYIGAIFILSGISVYISSFWDHMSSLLRVSITLGFGLLLYVSNLIFTQDERYKKIGYILTFVTVPFIIGGWYVFFDEYSLIDDIKVISAFIYLFVSLQYSYLYFKEKSNLYLVVSLLSFYLFINVSLILSGLSMIASSIIFGASLIIVSLNKTNNFKGLKIFMLVVGFFYFYSGLFNLLISYSISNDVAALMLAVFLLGTKFFTKEIPILNLAIEFVGTSIFYISLFNITKGNPVEPIYLLISGGILYYSLLINNNITLTTSVVSFMSFVLYYSSEYFVSSIGWSLSLVLFGVTCLALGTLVINVKKKQKE